MKLMKTTGWLAIALGIVVLCGAEASAQTAPTLTATANGLQVTINWTDVPGATGYLLEAGTTSGGSQIATVPVVTRPVVVNPVPPGTYYLRVRAVVGVVPGPASNEVALTVTAPGCGTIAAPTLTSSVNGPAASFSWTNVNANDYILQFGLSSGRTDLAQQVSSTVTTYTQNVPITGTFVARVVARNACGQSATSNEVTFTISNLCGTQNPVLTAAVQGGTVNFNWTGVVNASSITLELSRFNGQTEHSEPVSNPAGTSYSRYIPLIGTFYGRIVVRTACGTASSAYIPFTITDLSIGGGPRTPDPAPGTIIPRATIQYGRDVTISTANAFPGDLLHSCREEGGNNIWLFRLVQRLRQRDTRWGLNYKRGNRGDMSQDIVTYNPTSGPDVQAQQIYLYDVIGGHCGPAPTWNWADVTDVTWDGGAQGLCSNRYCALWAIDEYLRAGFPPDGQQ